jgi:hypothetical protein
VREKWVEMMNAAMERHGQEQRLDARSWANQGRNDLASLREEKTLQGHGPEAMERHREIDQLRVERAELPPPHLDRAAAIEHLEQKAEQQIAGVKERESQELSRLDKLIAAARELGNEVKDRTVAVAQNVAERMEQLRGQFNRWREQQTDAKPEQNLDTQIASPTQQKQELQRAGPEQDIDPQIEQRLQAFRERYEANKQMREPAIAPEPPVKETALEKEPEQELKIERGRGFGHGL